MISKEQKFLCPIIKRFRKFIRPLATYLAVLSLWPQTRPWYISRSACRNKHKRFKKWYKI